MATLVPLVGETPPACHFYTQGIPSAFLYSERQWGNTTRGLYGYPYEKVHSFYISLYLGVSPDIKTKTHAQIPPRIARELQQRAFRCRRYVWTRRTIRATSGLPRPTHLRPDFLVEILDLFDLAFKPTLHTRPEITQTHTSLPYKI